MNASSSELDVDQLMSTIRDAASEKHPDLDAHTKQEAIPYGLLLHIKQKNERDQLTFSPEFMFHSDDTYHVNDLLMYHDRDFVRNAYRAILKREPDEAGFLHNLELLRSGAFNKIDILASLRSSDEGKLNGVRIAGLRLPSTIRTLERIPVFGYLLQLLLAFVRLPSMIRSQRQFQGYLVAQQFAIADYVNERQRMNANELQQHRSTLANRLNALDVTVNETVLPRILTEQENLKHLKAQVLRFNDRFARLSKTPFQTAQQISPASDVKTVASEGNRTIDELREWDNFYAAFEEQFRGSPEEVEERLRFYLPFVRELKPDSKILDIGSGRGDWLKLLKKEGFTASGVEINKVLAELSCKEGLDVTHGEMMEYLGLQPDDSLDLITVFHLIEHFDADKLFRLLDEIKRTLKPGGRLFIETPSPENIVVAACNFYADPTHHKPINPHTLMFLLRQKGFVELGLQFLHPVEESPFKGESEGSEQLHMWFYGPRDFAVIARKAQ